MNYILYTIDMETIAFTFALLLGHALYVCMWYFSLKNFKDTEYRPSSYNKKEVEDLINNVISNGR